MLGVGNIQGVSLPYHSHEDLEPNRIRQMSQLGHGDALWFIIQFFLSHTPLNAYDY